MDDDDRLVPDLPPHDEYLERGVLGAILAQPDREHARAIQDDLGAFLEASDFWREAHRSVYVAVRRAAVARGGDGVLIGDLFGALDAPAGRSLFGALGGSGGPAQESAFLTGLVVDASPAAIVKLEALHLADLGAQRLLLEAGRCGTPEQLAALNDRVRAKRDRIAAARNGRRPPADAAFDLLAGR